PETAVVTKTRLHACSGKVGRFPDAQKSGTSRMHPDALWGTGAVMQMPVFSRLSTYAVTIGALLASAATALAAPGQPSPWALGLQEAGSPVMTDITWFHNFLLVIITVITAFVLILLLTVVIRFNARANPTPWRTTHNALIEVMWTIVPVVILLAIA